MTNPTADTGLAARESFAFLLPVQRHLPGVLASATIGIAATFLSEHYGGPVMLFALLLGMAFHFLAEEGRCVAGVELASKRLLRLAVGLLGAQITVAEIVALGPTPVFMMIAAVVLTMTFGVIAARILRLDTRFGVLTGGAVSICGASAALAIASVLPKGGTAERDTAFTVIAVTTLSTVAMILYPLIAGAFHLDHAAAGIFLGGTIHDVAQVVGAGFSISDETGNIATFTKLLRVALLLPVVFTLSIAFSAGRTSGSRSAPLPGFLLLFAALVVLGSTGVIPPDGLALLKAVSRWCLVTAIAALGMRTSLKAIADVGGRAVVLIVAETVFLAVMILAVILWLR